MVHHFSRFFFFRGPHDAVNALFCPSYRLMGKKTEPKAHQKRTTFAVSWSPAQPRALMGHILDGVLSINVQIRTPSLL
jgi:hypothetical protein